MCRYIGDNNRTTPKKSAVELTGNVSTDVSKNIYDLAGNCSEWTMEADRMFGDKNWRISRGGDLYNGHVSRRTSFAPYSLNGNDGDNDVSIGFRCTLYIK